LFIVLSEYTRDLNREINENKRGYQSRSNLVKDENGDPLADSHSILNRWKNYVRSSRKTGQG
jgi:hypothetical protein